MNETQTSKESQELTVRVPFSPEERRAFDLAMEKGHHFKGGWVKAAIIEKLARERHEQIIQMNR